MNLGQSQWELQYLYKADTSISFSSLAFSQKGNLLAAGTTDGKVVMFKRNAEEQWDKMDSFHGTSFESSLNPTIDRKINDMEFAPVNRNTHVLITAMSKEIGVWFVADHKVPIPAADFVPKGLEFPVIDRTRNDVCSNEAALIQAPNGQQFHGIKTNPDGLTFGYTQDHSLIIRKIDVIEPSLPVYKSDRMLTRLDFHPNDNEVVIVGDEMGRANIIDMRIEPTTDKPTKFASIKNLSSQFQFVSDVKFSANGRMFFTRHYSDVVFWDYRNLMRPLAHVRLEHEFEDAKNLLTPDGKDIFRTVWLDDEMVATGSFSGKLFTVSYRGNITRHVSEGLEERPKFWSRKEAKRKHAKEHCVNVIAMSTDRKRIATTNTTDVLVYDIIKK